MRFFTMLLVGGLLVLSACSGGGTTGGGDEGKADGLDGNTLDGTGDVEAAPDPCGNGVCDETGKGLENCNTCPDDCGICCGNGVCDTAFGETCISCTADCPKCLDPCGDGVCDQDNRGDGYIESCETCEIDCGACQPECGNGKLEEGEDCDDGNLDPGDGCDAECKTEAPPGCGDGECKPEEDENCKSCPADCPECCPDTLCDEDGGESCDSCPDDCGLCPGCGDGIVQVDLDEQCDDGNTDPDDGCDEECLIEIVEVEPGAIVITEIMKDPKAVDDAAGEWLEVFNTTDAEIDINGWMLMDEGTDDHPIFALDGVKIPAKGFFVLGRENDPSVNGGVTVGYKYSGFSLANKEDEVILVAGEVTIDAVKYDDGVAFPDDEGKALSLSAEVLSADGNDLGANWCDAKDEYGDGDFGTPGMPNPNCKAPEECGNNVLEAGEECDDGNTDPDDGCDETCQSESPLCPDEECDPPEDCETCPQDCGECTAECGNGITEEGEDCDDGDQDDCNGCTSDCKIQECGDGACNCTENCFTCPDDCESCCGNDKCDKDEYGENCILCPEDCGDCCGDQVCDPNAGETCAKCPADCGACAVCPDGLCNGVETCGTCPQDCGACVPVCGDGKKDEMEQCDDGDKTPCDGCSPTCHVEGCGTGECSDACGEDCYNCPDDCGACCGDGQCVAGHGETCKTCEKDCDPCCGNAKCEANFNEDCATCAADCGACVPKCPDGLCNGTENCSTCAQDCGQCCGNGKCEAAYGETIATCAADCQPAGTWCSLSGNQGATVSCELQLAAESASSPKATGVQFKINYDAAKVSLSKFSCIGAGGLDFCDLLSLLATGHSIAVDPAKASWNGLVSVLIYHGSEPTKPITQAYMSGGNVSGDGKMMTLVFTLKQAIAAGSPVKVTLTDLKGTDADASPLTVTQQGGVLVSAKGGAQPVCGDKQCNGTENCNTCAGDCGQCCGDGQCTAAYGETCTSCAQDCGACPACPDGKCNGTETCSTCPQDCGACPPSGWCALSGNQGATVNCELKLAAATAASNKATGVQFKINYDAAKVSLAKFSCIGAGGLDFCDLLSLLTTGHAIAVDPAKASWNGLVSVLIYHASAPTTTITQAYMSGGNVSGDGKMMTLVFTLKQAIAAGSPVQVTLTNLKGTDAAANTLTVTLQNGVLVTTP